MKYAKQLLSPLSDVQTRDGFTWEFLIKPGNGNGNEPFGTEGWD